ncbi:MAG TPA: acyl-CoA synthetase [Deltaproteobacteria bacterium]|nr:acyl-CoA synthetase [Deltaproteobacteria bacterium]
MNQKQRQNLERLLNPRHLAIIGGRDAEAAARECARIGYAGKIWPVNPKREKIGGIKCFANVEDLPEAPDAVYLAIPREAAISTVERLAKMGAGGVVCYTAGFSEIGAEGAELEEALVTATGDLALVGPNCYGVINYIDKVALWPFPHGGASPGYGVAIITQSGMLSSDLSMSQRSLPFAYMISVGNQTFLRLEDFIDVLCTRPEVKAIGLHIEGLKDISRFSEVALKALDAGVPIVALKTGSSKIGSELTVSHTASLSGSDDLFQALFDRLGIIRVSDPSQLLETLKFICVAGIPKGKRLVGLTCSGGGATMLADHAETIGLEFPRPSEKTIERLTSLLYYTATVSNPLDYTTPIWGIPERVSPVFEALLTDPYDSAIFVQDYPPPELDESKPYYLSDAKSFIEASSKVRIPSAICSTLPENMDQSTREMLVENGVAPMQGIHEALNAISAAAWYFGRRETILKNGIEKISIKPLSGIPGAGNVSTLVDEWEGKQLLQKIGLNVPEGRIAESAEVPEIAEKLGFPVVIKMVGKNLEHKTDAGAVALNLSSCEEVKTAVDRIKKDVEHFNPDALSEQFLVEKMLEQPIAELLVNVRTDSQFGMAMTLAAGGILTELLADAVTILLPTSRNDLENALKSLKISKLFCGFRGGEMIETEQLVSVLFDLVEGVRNETIGIKEIEINPLFVYKHKVCAVDVLMRVAK